ncbi:MAG: hypothetical protein HY901_29685 [Deltaproteobacteria bacterium]|nr:hypothetical protein [Deltaproteobacteria bacterium]
MQPATKPFAGTNLVVTAAALAAAALLVCALHATLARRGGPLDPLAGVEDMAEAHALTSPALAAPEDLRHPEWARPEMPVAGQPALIDPRPAALVVRPPPFSVRVTP